MHIRDFIRLLERLEPQLLIPIPTSGIGYRLEARDGRARRNTRLADAVTKTVATPCPHSQDSQTERVHDVLEQIPPDVDRWLDKVKFAGKPTREYFDGDAARAQASRAGFQRLGRW